MIYAVGTDMIEIARIEKAVRSDAFLNRCFTEEERREAEGKPARLAGDFAVKEAVAKALRTGFRGFWLTDIECLRDALGAPYVRLYGGARARCEAEGIVNVHVSISNTKTTVIATAVAEQKG